MNSFAIRTPRKMGRLWRWTSRSRMDCSIQVTRRVPPRKSSIVAAQPFQFLTNNGGLIMAEEAVHKGVVVQVKSTDDPDVLHMVGSTEVKDADGDIIRVKGWDLKRYKNNPVIMWAHNYALPPIGKAVKIHKNVEQLQLEFWIRFSKDEFAQRIKGLYDEGIMKMSSVGFIVKERTALERNKDADPDEPVGWEFRKQELLELSCVPIGSNPEALARAISKGVTGEELKGLLYTVEHPEAMKSEIIELDEATIED